MATAMNCTVKTYKKVPLVKGGTEVLYLSQGSAEGVLGAFLHKTYTRYYYTRENEGAIQVDDTIPNLEGCNYVSFQNLSHGGKIFFGFIDRLVYINDNNTEIQFTIDPFPTYLGDTKEREDVFIVRNTPLTDSLDFIAEDFDFEGQKLTDYNISSTSLPLTKALTIFTGGRLTNDDGTITVASTENLAGTQQIMLYGHATGIQAKVGLTEAEVRTINQSGGSIIGCYAVDAGFDISNLTAQQIAGSVLFPAVQHLKLNTGQYNKIVLDACGQSKVYDLNRFSTAPTINFTLRRILAPVPYVAIIPNNYKGFAENTSEAVIIPYPSLAFAVGNAYDMSGVIKNSFNNFVASMDKANTADTVMKADQSGRINTDPSQLGNWIFHPALTAATALGYGLSSMPDVIGNARRAIGTAKQGTKDAEITSSTGSLVLAANNTMQFNVRLIRHAPEDIAFLDDYFEYYGYAMNRFMTPNTQDKAYLQTGSEFLVGSEVDVSLNNYLARGIKIRKTLS